MITSKASPLASKKLTTVCRPAAVIRVSASANRTVKTMSGRISPLAAAANALRGTRPEEIGNPRKRPRRLLLDARQAPPEASSPCCATAGRHGSEADAESAPKTAEPVQMITIHSTAARRFARRALPRRSSQSRRPAMRRRGDDRHLQRIEPQGADERGHAQAPIARAGRKSLRCSTPATSPRISAASAQ